MADLVKSIGSLLRELGRRKVYRVAVTYIVIVAGGLELVDLVIPSSRLPEWSNALFLALALFAFPLVMYLAWTFDVTAKGLQRTPGQSANEETAVEAAAGVATIDEPDPSVGSTPAPDAEPASALDERAVAVLPFENLGNAEDAGPFAAGLHHDLLTELSKISALTVISRTSVMGYRGGGKTIPQIARELGAGTVIEGGVQTVGDRVRLNIQLIDARKDVHLWAERYDRELTTENIFDLQSELSSRIAATLRAKLTPEEEARRTAQPTDDIEAYRLHALGRDAFAERSEEGMAMAIEYFESAIERDPDFAQAWGGLALTHVLLADYMLADPVTALPRGEEAALRALTLDPELSEAHAAMGCLYSARREGSRALKSHARAIELQPSYGQAHGWLCWVHLLLGHPEVALDAGRRAVQLQPVEPEARTNLSLAYLGCGDSETAWAEAQRALEAHPDFDYARWAGALALSTLDRSIEADTQFQPLSEPWARSWPEAIKVLARAAAGDEAAVRQFAVARNGGDESFFAALALAALGELGQTFDALRRASPLSWSETLYLRYALPQVLAPLRDDPRYLELIQEVDRSWGKEPDSFLRRQYSAPDARIEE